MNELYVVTYSDENLAYSLDAANWTPVNEKTNVVASCEKFYWFPLTLQVRKILSCLKRNKSEGAVKLRQYIYNCIK